MYPELVNLIEEVSSLLSNCCTSLLLLIQCGAAILSAIYVIVADATRQ
jgi:hypothetical protein